MEPGGLAVAAPAPDPAAAGTAPAPRPVERLSSQVQQQLNLESLKTRAIGLHRAISRVLDDLEACARANQDPKWQDVLGQFSMVSMELFNIVEDVKKVSKAFVVFPRNVNAETSTILPVMLSSKLLPEMEAEDNTKREQLLCGITNLPVQSQMEKLKARIDMIATACDTAEKVIADSRKTYGLGLRQGPSLVPALDKAQAAKIEETENKLRSAFSFGKGLQIPANERQITLSLPGHLIDAYPPSEGSQNFGENSGLYQKNTPSFTPINANQQPSGAQLLGRSVPSPSGVTKFENVSTPPMPYANSPRSGANIINTQSPQQQLHLQQQQQQQQRQKIIQASQHLLAQQQMRPSNAGILGQNAVSQLQDLQGQTQQQKLNQINVPTQLQMQYAQSLSQLQNRQMQSVHSMAQNQINQGSLRNHLNQFTGTGSSALFNAAQVSANPQMMTNMSAAMHSQFGLTGGHQRSHPSQILNDPMFAMGANPASMMGMQQQQQQQQSVYGNLPAGAQNLQSGVPNPSQNPNLGQLRQQNQQ